MNRAGMMLGSRERTAGPLQATGNGPQPGRAAATVCASAAPRDSGCRKCGRWTEPAFLQQPLPFPGRKQRRAGDKALVRVFTESLEEADCDHLQATVTRGLDHQQHARWSQKPAHVMQCGAQVARIVENLVRHDDVEGVRRPALRFRGAVDVQKPVVRNGKRENFSFAMARKYGETSV